MPNTKPAPRRSPHFTAPTRPAARADATRQRAELRQAARKQFGGAAEALAVDWLVAHGYRIRARNVPCRVGELDIVAEKEGLICIVEVRMRSSSVWGDPAATVTFAKQRKVVKAAMYYLQGERLLNRVMVRFDVISVIGRGPTASVEHLPGAFDAGF